MWHGRTFVCHIWRISTISQKLRRQRDDTAESQKHYVGATSCHAISSHVINSPTHLYCITYWLADNLGMLFSWLDSASSIVIDSHAINFCIHHPRAETIQVSARETAAVWFCRRPESEQQFQHLCHDACPNRPIPSWTSGISARGRCHHILGFGLVTATALVHSIPKLHFQNFTRHC